jgi:hypothetical protein
VPKLNGLKKDKFNTMLRLLYEAINQGLLRENHMNKQRPFFKQLLNLRKKYCNLLKVERIEYSSLIQLIKERELDYYNENAVLLNSVLSEPKHIDLIKIKEVILDSLKLDLDNPKIELGQKILLVKNINDSLDNLGKPLKRFDPFKEMVYTTCPITFLADYTRAGKGDSIVFAAPEKTGKTAVTLINVVEDCLVKGKEVLYLDYANGWHEVLLRIASIINKTNYGTLSSHEINTVLNTFKRSEVFLRLMSKLRYEQYPDKNTTKELIAEKQYDYVVFDDLHRLIFDANMAESTLKAYNWAVDLGKQYDQCNLILGHPNDVNATMETFVLSGGVRVHKDLTTIVAMLKTDEKGINEIKIIVERKRVTDLHAKIVLNGILDYKLEPLSSTPVKLNTVLKPLGKQSNNELLGLGDLDSGVLY